MKAPNDQKIGPLKKVSVAMAAGRSPTAMDLMMRPATLQFIFGLAPTGWTPLEHALFDKRCGQQAVLHLKKSQLRDAFGHLASPMVAGLDEDAAVCLAVAVTAIVPADNREVVKALAEMAACQGCCENH
jgi:hypothetical protein